MSDKIISLNFSCARALDNCCHFAELFPAALRHGAAKGWSCRLASGAIPATELRLLLVPNQTMELFLHLWLFIG